MSADGRQYARVGLLKGIGYSASLRVYPVTLVDMKAYLITLALLSVSSVTVLWDGRFNDYTSVPEHDYPFVVSGLSLEF